MYGYRNETKNEYVAMSSKKVIRLVRDSDIEKGDICSDIEYNRRPLAKIIWLGKEISEQELADKFTYHFGDDEEVDYDHLAYPMISDALSDALDAVSCSKDVYELADVLEEYLKIVQKDLVYGEMYADYPN